MAIHFEDSAALVAVGAFHWEHLKTVRYLGNSTTDEKFGRSYVIGRSVIEPMDNNFFQYESGFFTEEAWAMYKGRIRVICRDGVLEHTILTNHPEYFRSSFVELCFQMSDV